jgi:3-oxoacyl-(acyl-carrier-protein) synthase
MPLPVIIEQGALVSALGSLRHTTDALCAGKSALKPSPCFDIPVASAPFADTALRSLDNAFEHLREQLNLSAIRNENPLFILAAAKGDLRALEPNRQPDNSVPHPLLALQARRIARIIDINPAQVLVVSNACASGAVAVALAKSFLERELFTTAVIAGFDVISRFVITGFHSLSALSPEGARPFDINRNGLSLGDGAALAILRSGTAGKGEILIAGADQSNDANHRTGPSRTGDGLYAAAAGALRNAGCTPEQVGAVKCHGTATPYNDAMEAKAMTSCFPLKRPPCFSMKGAIGHTSGGGSLLEILLAGDLLRRRMVPPTINFRTPDPDAALPVSTDAVALLQPSMLCLSAGFGGLNAAVLLKEHTG